NPVLFINATVRTTSSLSPLQSKKSGSHPSAGNAIRPAASGVLVTVHCPHILSRRISLIFKHDEIRITHFSFPQHQSITRQPASGPGQPLRNPDARIDETPPLYRKHQSAIVFPRCDTGPARTLVAGTFSRPGPDHD